MEGCDTLFDLQVQVEKCYSSHLRSKLRKMLVQQLDLEVVIVGFGGRHHVPQASCRSSPDSTLTHGNWRMKKMERQESMCVVTHLGECNESNRHSFNKFIYIFFIKLMNLNSNT